MKNTKIENKTGNTYVRVTSNGTSANNTPNVSGHNDSNANKDSQKIKMNPVNYWCGPHFLFHIN